MLVFSEHHSEYTSMKTVPRKAYRARVKRALQRAPVTVLLGPRQCGKTTLARGIAREAKGVYLDLESAPVQQRLQNPEMALSARAGLQVLDEIQLMPSLFNVLRVLVDRPGFTGRFLVLGSASPGLVRGASESLAGRAEFVELSGFNTDEIGPGAWRRRWVRGGFPRSYLARSEDDSVRWREAFIRAFLERDLPQLGIAIPAPAMRRFWMMVAHYHGQTWNGSELSRSLGVSDKTVRRYLDILTQAYMLRQLQPWHENLGKRQVKSPKVYFRDSGLLHTLLSIPGEDRLLEHPRVGASWEGFALEEILNVAQPAEPYFWATQAGAELDLFFLAEGRRYGIEFKFSETPQISKSMRVALEDLKLDHLWVVCPGAEQYAVAPRISVAGLGAFRKAWQTRAS